MKQVIIIIAMVGGLSGLAWWLLSTDTTEPIVVDTIEVEIPDAEAAEITGFNFMQDIIAGAPGDADMDAVSRVYEALSRNARTVVSEETIMADIAMFVGIQDVPDQGVSIQDLQTPSATEASLIVGLNYTGGPVLRSINMVVEDGEWKIDSVDVLETYPEETEPPGTPDGSTTPVTQGDCYRGGCSGQVCSDDPEVMTTCEWREEYACYVDAVCERQSDGECGWTQTEELVSCLAAASSEVE